jgi:hypothetical protein
MVISSSYAGIATDQTIYPKSRAYTNRAKQPHKRRVHMKKQKVNTSRELAQRSMERLPRTIVSSDKIVTTGR